MYIIILYHCFVSLKIVKAVQLFFLKIFEDFSTNVLKTSSILMIVTTF